MTANRTHRSALRCLHSLMAVVVAIAVSSGGCSTDGDDDAGPAPEPVDVTTVVVAARSLPEVYVAAGTVRSRTQASVAAQVMGAVRELHVEPGDRVEAGELLARLDDRDLRAEYERARADFLRASALLAKQALTRAEFEAVESRFRVAEAGVSHTEIRAPFAGVVADKFCDVGDMAAPGKQMFSIERADAFRVETPIPERLAGSVAVGDQADVTIDASGRVCAGTVGEVLPSVDSATRSFLIKVELTCANGVRSGAFARVRLQVGRRNSITVPQTAVHRRGQLTYVFVAGGGRSEMRLVRLGDTDSNRVEVLAGLDQGETLITAASGDLTDGSPVRENPDLAGDGPGGDAAGH